MQISLSVKKLYTGKDWMKEVVVEIENGIIKNISDEDYDANNAIPIVIPALIDLQIYGAENKLLSEFPEATPLKKFINIVCLGGLLIFNLLLPLKRMILF